MAETRPPCRFSIVRAEVEERLAWVERQMLAGVPPGQLDRAAMQKFGIVSRRTLRRYRAAVERRWPPLNDEAAKDAYRARLLARVEWGVNRCVKNEAIARRSGDIAAANGSVRVMAAVMAVGAKVTGVEAARKVEVTKKVASPLDDMTPAERKMRALRHAARLQAAADKETAH